MSRRNTPANVNYSIKGFAKLGLVIAAFVLLIWIVLRIAVAPKDPITSNQVWDTMVAQGYEPQDITENYYAQDPNFRKTLSQCIAFEKDDVHFEFFVFNDKSGAVDLYGQAYKDIILHYNAINKIEIDNQVANYSVYTLDSLGKYNVAIYVENTAIYAYCNSENKREIQLILDAIDYLKLKE